MTCERGRKEGERVDEEGKEEGKRRGEEGDIGSREGGGERGRVEEDMGKGEEEKVKV